MKKHIPEREVDKNPNGNLKTEEVSEYFMDRYYNTDNVRMNMDFFNNEQ